MIKIQNEKVLECYETVSFDIKYLLTKVPLEHTVDITIKRTSEKLIIKTVFTKDEMKKRLTSCAKNVHSCFNNDIYIHIDGGLR